MPILLFLAASGCTDFALEAAEGATGARDTGTGEAADGGADSANDDADNYVAAWYTLAASLQIAEGIPTTNGAIVRFVLGDAALVRQDCAPLELVSLVVTDPPAETFYAQWSLDVPAETGCVATDLALPLTLGIALGPLDPEVRAQLGTVGLDQEASHLWGASFSADGGALLPFGYASAAIDADASVAPTDGTYVLEPLLLQPVPGE